MASELSPFGWTPGNYWFVCRDCRKKQCVGSKRSWRCEDCAKVAAAKWNEPDTRPAPAATDTGLVTVRYEIVETLPSGTTRWKCVEHEHHANSVAQMLEHPTVVNALVRRSQAEELLAAERASAAEKERLRFEGDLDKWMKIIGAGITGYQPEAYALMDLACQELVKLRADNAAQDARIKELRELLTKIADKGTLQALKDANDRSEYLEAKLAAAEKALEGLREKGRKVLDVLKAWEDDSDLINSGEIVADFRAVLGGKPS